MKSKSFLVSIVCAFIFVLVSISSQAQTTYEFQEGINGYSGTSDMTFFLSDQGALTGDDAEWEWDGEDGGLYNVGVLHFDNIIGEGEGLIPPNSTVVDAFVTLYVTNEGSSDQIATVHNLLKPFDEAADYIEFTDNLEPVAGDDYDEEVVTEIPGPSAGDIIQVNVASSLQSWINGDAENLGWMFIPGEGATNGVGIQSSEVPVLNVPRLIINTPDGEYVFEEGVNGYEGTVDTWLDTSESFETVRGGDTTFEWDGEDAGFIYYGLLRFDDVFGDGPNQIAPGTTIDSAIVELTVIDEGDPANFHEVLEGTEERPTAFNDETTSMANWADTFEPLPGTDYNEEVAGTIEGNIGTNEVDVTSSFQSYSDGEENRGWIIVPTGTGGTIAVASEQAHNPRPMLVVDTPDGEFTFQDGVNDYDGTVDTWLNTADNFNVVFGEEDTFEWDGDDAGGENNGLLRFDNIIGDGPNQIPPGTTINSANIFLNIVDEGSTAGVHDILEGTAERPTTFDETTTSMETWGDTFFPEAGVDYAEEPVTIADSGGDAVNEGRLSIDVTSSIERYSNGEPNTGWIFIPLGGGGVEAVSSNATVVEGEIGPPKLTVIVEGGTGIANFFLY